MPKEGLSLREEQFVDLLPANDWIVWKAGVEAGFSESYARDRLPALVKIGGKSSKVVLIEAIDAKRAEMSKEIGITITQLTEKRLSLLKTAIDKGNLQAADRMLQALEKHKGYYEEDNRQAQAQAQAAAEMSPDEAIAYHLRCLNRLKAVREAPDARSTG